MEIINTDSNAELELRIVYLMVNSTEFMDEFMEHYQKGMFDNKYHTLVGQLACAYYRNYNKAVGANMERWFSNAVSLKKISADNAAEVSIILQALNNQPPIVDIELEINEAFNWLRAKTLALSADEAKALAEEGKLNEAVELIHSVEDVQRTKADSKDIYDYTKEEYEEILTETSEQLFTVPYAFGKVINDTLVRNGFIAFMGRPKVGKSWELMYLARCARDSGCKTIFISAGDMTKPQTLRRMLQGDAKTTTSEYYLDKQFTPCYDCVQNQLGLCMKRKGDGSLLNDRNELPERPVITSDEYIPCCDFNCITYQEKKNQTISYRQEHNPILTADRIMQVKQEWEDSGNTGKLVVEYAPTNTLTLAGRRARIKAVCKREGWEHPDVVIVDYANILAYEGHDERDSIHQIWQGLRADADIFDCLVITATHSNSSAFDFEDLTLRSFALDRRIFDEVTACYAINQKPEEKRFNIWRIASLLKRENDYDETQQAECYGCLAMGTPHIISRIVYRDLPKPQQNFKK